MISSAAGVASFFTVPLTGGLSMGGKPKFLGKGKKNKSKKKGKGKKKKK